MKTTIKKALVISVATFGIIGLAGTQQANAMTYSAPRAHVSHAVHATPHRSVRTTTTHSSGGSNSAMNGMFLGWLIGHNSNNDSRKTDEEIKAKRNKEDLKRKEWKKEDGRNWFQKFWDIEIKDKYEGH